MASQIAVVAGLLVLSACSSGGGQSLPSSTPSTTKPSPTQTATPSPSTSSPTATQTPTPTQTSKPPPTDTLAGWTLEQRVGQLFMVGVNVASAQQASYDAISTYHVGNLFLAGRTHAGTVRVKNLVDSFTELVSPTTTNSTPLFVATDQEGGLVQVLQGPGYSTIPSAMDQSGLALSTLQADAATWGAQLASSGVNLNLAPVMDLVPSAADALKNPPIGYFHRNYGYTVDSVTSHANAFSAGMESSGVDVTIKHFPGLGRVTANTDTTAGVTDTVTSRTDPSVQCFKSGIAAGSAVVMMSTAIYSLIDPAAPAAFSPIVVNGLLRGDLGFDGVVITDDVSAAKQVQAWSPGDRAVLTIEAGGDIVLASADPTVIPAMVDAVVAKAKADPTFAAQVDAAVLRVLAAKKGL